MFEHPKRGHLDAGDRPKYPCENSSANPTVVNPAMDNDAPDAFVNSRCPHGKSRLITYLSF